MNSIVKIFWHLTNIDRSNLVVKCEHEYKNVLSKCKKIQSDKD
jgi:hypothetical protein